MRRLERSSLADSDLSDILDFGVARFGERVGVEYFYSFDAAFSRISARPEIGTAINPISPGVRRLTHRRHRIFYSFTDESVLILRVLHHAQDVSAKLPG